MRPPWTRSGSSSACCGHIMSHSGDDRSGSVRPRKILLEPPMSVPSAIVISLKSTIPPRRSSARPLPLRIDRRDRGPPTSALSLLIACAIGRTERPSSVEVDLGRRLFRKRTIRPTKGSSLRREFPVVWAQREPSYPDGCTGRPGGVACDLPGDGRCVRRSAESWSTVRDWLTLCWS